VDNDHKRFGNRYMQIKVDDEVQILCLMIKIFSTMTCGQCVDIFMINTIIKKESLISTNGDNL